MHIKATDRPIRVQYLKGGRFLFPDDNKNDLRCLYVGRPTPWANPYKAGQANTQTRAEAVEAFRHFVAARPTLQARIRQELRGKNLACWCALDGGPCHADILLEIANTAPRPLPKAPHPCRHDILNAVDNYLDGILTRNEALAVIERTMPMTTK